jgi:Ser/Thr protein kinase RdoA (MazF antagonist)
LRLVFKDLGRDALDERALAAKPAFLQDSRREIEVYATLLAPSELGTATYYGSVVEPQQDRYWLFLERVEGVPLWQVGELDTWREVAQWLARMQSGLGRRRTRALLAYDRAFYRRWLPRALAFTPEAGLDRLAPAYERAIARLASAPTTFVHGELYASNVLVGERNGRRRICPIDWELAGVGVGLLDLAALTSGFDEEKASSLVRAYRDALAAPPPPGVLEELLDCCRLHLAVRWLGWSPTWTPPPEHARDWAREAFSAAERLELLA